MGILNKLFGRKESKGTKNSETEGRKPIPPDRLSKIKRGGFGEPYCSDKCYSKAGKEISNRILMGTSGVCGFCQSSVYASMENAGEVVLFPYKGQMFFVCKSCFSKGKEYVKTIDVCCMCGKRL